MDLDLKKVKERELRELLDQFDKKLKVNKSWLYNPGRALAPTPKQLEFHELGGLPGVRFRCLRAGNQLGKTLSGSEEIYFHASGKYPYWWKGYRFDRPLKIWASGVTGASTRDNPQRLLLGETRHWGTGAIPKEDFARDPTLARGGVPDLVDSVEIKHISGGISIIWFKSYQEGREKWQGQTLDIIWYDEEPPKDIWDEGKARLADKRGISILTFTPLLGATEVYDLFQGPKSNPDHRQYRLVLMTIDDASYLTPQLRKERIDEWPEAERQARLYGMAMFGEGLVIPFPDGMLMEEPFEIPKYFRRLFGLDVGVGHPTAFVGMAHDPDTDIIHIYDTYRREDPIAATHAMTLKGRRGDQFPVSWPHDALKSNPKSGENVKEIYRKLGVRMMPFSARYDDTVGGPQGNAPIIMEIINRIKSDRFKVFKTLREWFQEKSTWHYKNGKPVPFKDDLMSATLYAAMMLRHARPDVDMRAPVVESNYDPLGDSWNNGQIIELVNTNKLFKSRNTR